MRKALALVAVVAAALACAQVYLDGDDGGILFTSADSDAPFTVSETFDFSAAATQDITTLCVGNAHCKAMCMVHPNTGDWECIDNAGATKTGMTQGVGATYAGSYAFAPDGGFYQALHYVDDTSSASAIPRINDPDIRALFGTSAYTVMVVGYASTLVDPTTQWWGMITDGTNMLQMRAESNTFKCVEKNGTYSAAGTGLNGWSIAMCRRDDATHASARLYGVTGQTAVNAESAITGTNAFYFGGGTGACCTPGGSSGGDFLTFLFFDDARTDAWVDSAERMLNGVPTVQSGGNGTAGTTASSATGVTCRMPQDGGFYVDCFNAGMYIVDRKLGVAGTRGFGNAWATDPLAAASWTDVGTPIVTSNTASGPFSRWHNAAECDLIEDDDGAAFEGKRSGELGTQLTDGAHQALDGGFGVWANATCFLRTGTSGVTTDKARIRFITDGTLDAGSATCDISGLTSAPARVPGADGLSAGCYAWIDGASSIKADVLVGNAASDTGSIIACGCFLSNSLAPDYPEPHRNIAGANWPELDGGSVPHGNVKGAVEVVFQIPYSTGVYGANPIASDHVQGPYLIDAYNAAASHDILLALTSMVSNPSGTRKPGIQALMYGATGAYENRLDIPSFDTQSQVNFSQSTWYVMRYEWRPDTALLMDGGSPACRGKVYLNTCSDPATCTATTLIASNAAGDDVWQTTSPGECPLATDVADLLTREAGTSPTTGFIRRVSYYR